jgi:hypothetical protein
MTKTYGANIRCCICGAEPWPDNPATRECFDLGRFGPDGRPAESPTVGEWRCDEHRPERLPKQLLSRDAASPTEALHEFERLLATEGARLDEALASLDDDFAEIAVKAFHEEIARGLTDLRKASAH